MKPKMGFYIQRGEGYSDYALPEVPAGDLRTEGVLCTTEMGKQSKMGVKNVFGCAMHKRRLNTSKGLIV